MTTTARVEANRRNARFSTGPRTVAGKAVVARNAVRHGVFAPIPVVPGENPYDWDRHRAGVVAALDPGGLLEVNLAERAALLLWRLARLARFEAGTTTASVEDAGLLPPDSDPFASAFRPPITDDYLKITEQNLRVAQVNHAEMLAMADLLRHLRKPGSPQTCLTEPALTLLGLAYGENSDYAFRRSDPIHPSDPGFSAAAGMPAGKADVAWAAELVARGLDYYARATNAPPAKFRAHLQVAIDSRVAALEREVRRLEGDAAAIVRRAEAARSRAGDAGLLPAEQIAERVMKYEKHLHGQLTSTLHELERLQARRREGSI